MNLFPCPIATEPPIVVMHGRPRGKVMRQHAPRTAGSYQVQQTVDHLPHIRAARPSTRFHSWKQWLNQLPLLIGQVRWVRYSVHNSVIGQNTTFHTRSKGYYPTTSMGRGVTVGRNETTCPYRDRSARSFIDRFKAPVIRYPCPLTPPVLPHSNKCP